MQFSYESVETSFESYLDKFEDTIEIARFRRVYIRLVLMFKRELPAAQLKGAQELQKHLRDEQYSQSALDELQKSCRDSLNQNLSDNASMTREALLNQLLFGALLDSEETDFFYVTEPMFLFVKKMNVPPAELKDVLESEFVGLTL